MDYIQFFLIMSAIYIAPQLPPLARLVIGGVFVALAVAVLVMGR